MQRRQLGLIARLNRRHRDRLPGYRDLDARIRSFELAYRMQMDATDAFNINKEPQYIRQLYGDTLHGREFLIARRLLERGVRFIQLYHPGWDQHGGLPGGLSTQCRETDQASAALVSDLKQRGMLEDTLILWTTEFGRMPCAQGSKGRDHNPFVFTNWLAGGGIRGGVTHGESDEWGFRPADQNNPTSCHDIHATIMHQLGIKHEKLTYRYSGRDFRLTDVHGQVAHEIIA